MEEKQILITGANGQLGRALRLKFPKAYSVDIDTLDISNKEALKKFNWKNIKVIINAAAYTNVDEAETMTGRKLAWKVNANAVANLADIAAMHEITIVHISTDYVFDGMDKIHTETEEYSPLNVYGASKAAGDILLANSKQFYILRTSWVIGDGKNFVRTMIELGKKGVDPTVVADQKGRPTFTSELVRAIDYLLRTKIPFGVYNISNSGKVVSWASLAREIFRLANINQKVTDISTEQYYKNKPESAPRPLNSTLSLDKIQTTGFDPHNWEQDLKLYIEQELAK